MSGFPGHNFTDRLKEQKSAKLDMLKRAKAKQLDEKALAKKLEERAKINEARAKREAVKEAERAKQAEEQAAIEAEEARKAELAAAAAEKAKADLAVAQKARRDARYCRIENAVDVIVCDIGESDPCIVPVGIDAVRHCWGRYCYPKRQDKIASG